jgi:hypothetical protein
MVNILNNRSLTGSLTDRLSLSSQYVVDDPVVSNKHLRIYNIVYDHDNPREVAPLVYAQDMSLNGTRWNGALIDRSNGGVLLSDGDILQLSPALYLLFRCCSSQQMTDPFSPLQRREMKVSISSLPYRVCLS